MLLLLVCRHGLVPPPMCAVRALLPRPAVALAWCDGDIAADLDSSSTQQHDRNTNGHISPENGFNNAHGHVSSDDASDGAPAGATGVGQGLVDVVGSGFCEVLAVLLSDGELVFLRAVESDLWEETLEDQIALGGPRDYLLPLGYPAAAAATAAAAVVSSSSSASILANDAEYFGGLSMPSGPWSSNYGTAVTAVSTQGGDVQRLQFPPLTAAAAAAGGSNGSSGYDAPAIPLAEGRTVLGLVWLGPKQLLLLAAPLDEGLEEGEGTALIEVSVTLPASLFGLEAADSSSSSPQQQTAAVKTSYAGVRVLTAAAHPAGGAVLQLENGQLRYYTPSSSSSGDSAGFTLQQLQQQQQLLLPLPAAANFPSGCPTMLLLPGAPSPIAATAATPAAGSNAQQQAVRAAAMAPAVGLNTAGVLYWGSRVVAADVSSVAVRGGRPGGPALLYVTRTNLLYVVMVGQLPKYQHTLVSKGLCAV